MNGLLFQAMHAISTLCAQADVHGQPRVSITFDNPNDRERFKMEVKRQAENGGFSLGPTPWDFSEMTIHGVRLRVI
jgi:hypothetical protein